MSKIKTLISEKKIALTDKWENKEEQEVWLFFEAPTELIPEKFLAECKEDKLPEGSKIVNADIQLCFSGNEVKFDTFSQALIGPVISDLCETEYYETLDLTGYELSDEDLSALIALAV